MYKETIWEVNMEDIPFLVRLLKVYHVEIGFPFSRI